MTLVSLALYHPIILFLSLVFTFRQTKKSQIKKKEVLNDIRPNKKNQQPPGSSDSGNISEEVSNKTDLEMLKNMIDNDSDKNKYIFLDKRKINIQSFDSLIFHEKSGVKIGYIHESGNHGFIELNPHAHKKKKKTFANLILYSIKGNVTLKSEGEIYEIKKGDIINFDSDTSYELINGATPGLLMFNKIPINKNEKTNI